MQPPAEHVHWLFATGFLLLALCLLARAIVGAEVWDRRAWRAYLWPSLLFGLGVLMWPVMVFFTNSAIHMIAHGARDADAHRAALRDTCRALAGARAAVLRPDGGCAAERDPDLRRQRQARLRPDARERGRAEGRRARHAPGARRLHRPLARALG